MRRTAVDHPVPNPVKGTRKGVDDGLNVVKLPLSLTEERGTNIFAEGE